MNMSKFPNKGLYIITHGDNILDDTKAALDAGAKVVQYRDKSSDTEKRQHEAMHLQALCHRYEVPLIINDDISLAKQINANGVHLGADDGDIASAREHLGDKALIGVSCYNTLALALSAQQQGADYVAFGRFYPSQTKPQTVQADLPLLLEAKQQLQLPIVAIGGIKASNALPLLNAGADLLAVINAVYGQPDAYNATKKLTNIFN